MLQLLGYAGAATVGLGIALVVVGVARRARVPAAALAHAGLLPGPDGVVPQDASASVWNRLGGLLTQRVSGLARLVTAGEHRVRRRLDRAGVAMASEGFLAVKVTAAGASVLLAVLSSFLLGWPLQRWLLAVAVAAAVGWVAPSLWLLHVAQKRQQQIQRAMPETLDLLALTAQAGLGLEQGMAEVTAELPGPLGAELDRALKEQQLGRSRHDALVALAERNSAADLRTLTQALLQADKLGTPISQTLQVQARELRRVRRGRAREAAGKAPVRLLFPLVFGIFPAMFVVIIGPGVIGIMDALF